MGVFQDLIVVVNRAPWTLNIRFDGQEMPLVPGENRIPRETLLYALNQNPLMGTQDPDNPNVSGSEYLIGLPDRAKKYPCDPLTQEQIKAQKNNPSRFDYESLISPRMGRKDSIEVKGRKTPTSFEVKERVDTEFGGGD